MSNAELKRWAATLSDDGAVAINEDGMALIELDEDIKPTGAYCEIGGVPMDESTIHDILEGYAE
jgi:hypothetical protein